MTGDSWDVAVVGAGPAGCAAALGALRARPGSRVLLLDRARFPRDKSCGDGVAPQVRHELRRLGAEDALDGFEEVDRLRLGFPAGGRLDPASSGVVEAVMAAPAVVAPRRALDSRLVAAAVRAGAQLANHRVRAVHVRRDGAAVLDGEISARVVVAADGAHSAVAASLTGAGAIPARSPGAPTAVAIRGYAPLRPELAGAQVIAFADDPAGRWPAYAWSFPVGDGVANVGYGELLPGGTRPRPTRARLLQRLDDLLPGTAELGEDWLGHLLPLSNGRRRQPDGPVLLTGDALGLVNPMTGEGIHAAVASGAAAGRAAASAASPWAAGASYRRALAGAMGPHLRHMSAVARLARRPRVVRAGLRAARRDRAAFDDLVELGLADGTVTARLASGLVVSLLRGR